MRTINKARRFSPQCALAALKLFLTLRLLPDLSSDGERDSAAVDRLEKLVVTFVLFATMQSGLASASAVTELQDFLDTMTARTSFALSAKATHAAQTLIWKQVGTADPSTVGEWSSLLQHSVFDRAGHFNKAIIGR